MVLQLEGISSRRQRLIGRGGELFVLFCFTNYFFIWLCWVLVVARRVMKIFRHGTQILWLCHSGSVVAACWRSCFVPWEILVPWPGIEPVSPALIARHVLNHRPTGEVPMLLSLNPAISKAPPPVNPKSYFNRNIQTDCHPSSWWVGRILTCCMIHSGLPMWC